MKTKIKCAVSGIVTGCRPDIFDKRVAKAGSESNLLATYVCSEAKRKLRAGLSVGDIRSESATCGIDIAGLPSVESLENIVSALTGKSANATKSASVSAIKQESTSDNRSWSKFGSEKPDSVSAFVAAKK